MGVPTLFKEIQFSSKKLVDISSVLEPDASGAFEASGLLYDCLRTFLKGNANDMRSALTVCHGLKRNANEADQMDGFSVAGVVDEFFFHLNRIKASFPKRFILVLEGPCPSKQNTAKKRIKAKEKLFLANKFCQSSTVTDCMVNEVIRRCEELKIEVVISPGEAEATTMYFAKIQAVRYALISSGDSDCLLYDGGCTILFNPMWAECHIKGQKQVSEIRLRAAPFDLANQDLKGGMAQFDYDRWLLTCIFAGCDYFKAKRIAIKTAKGFFASDDNWNSIKKNTTNPVEVFMSAGAALKNYYDNKFDKSQEATLPQTTTNSTPAPDSYDEYDDLDLDPGDENEGDSNEIEANIADDDEDADPFSETNFVIACLTFYYHPVLDANCCLTQYHPITPQEICSLESLELPTEITNWILGRGDFNGNYGKANGKTFHRLGCFNCPPRYQRQTVEIPETGWSAASQFQVAQIPLLKHCTITNHFRGSSFESSVFGGFQRYEVAIYDRSFYKSIMFYEDHDNRLFGIKSKVPRSYNQRPSHETCLMFKIDSPGTTILEIVGGKCQCTIGTSQKCKHISTLLWYLFLLQGNGIKTSIKGFHPAFTGKPVLIRDINTVATKPESMAEAHTVSKEEKRHDRGQAKRVANLNRAEKTIVDIPVEKIGDLKSLRIQAEAATLSKKSDKSKKTDMNSIPSTNEILNIRESGCSQPPHQIPIQLATTPEPFTPPTTPIKNSTNAIMNSPLTPPQSATKTIKLPAFSFPMNVAIGSSKQPSFAAYSVPVSVSSSTDTLTSMRTGTNTMKATDLSLSTSIAYQYQPGKPKCTVRDCTRYFVKQVNPFYWIPEDANLRKNLLTQAYRDDDFIEKSIANRTRIGICALHLSEIPKEKHPSSVTLLPRVSDPVFNGTYTNFGECTERKARDERGSKRIKLRDDSMAKQEVKKFNSFSEGTKSMLVLDAQLKENEQIRSNLSLELQKVKLQRDQLSLQKNFFTLSNIIKQPDYIVSHYTGFSSSHYLQLFISFCEYSNLPALFKRKRNVKYDDILLMYLVRTAQAYSCYHLLSLFPQFSTLSCISHCFSQMAGGIRKVIEKNIHIFRDKPTSTALTENLSDVTHIIDCTEFQIPEPRGNHMFSKLKFSPYYDRYTAKVLFILDNQLLVKSVSDCYGGSTSDVRICEASKFFDGLVKDKDHVLADKGFRIYPHLNSRGVKFSCPAFCSKGQLPTEDVIKSKIVSRARIHVERGIGRMKLYRILDNISQSLLPILDDIVFNCAFLSSFFRKPILAADNPYITTTDDDDDLNDYDYEPDEEDEEDEEDDDEDEFDEEEDDLP